MLRVEGPPKIEYQMGDNRGESWDRRRSPLLAFLKKLCAGEGQRGLAIGFQPLEVVKGLWMLWGGRPYTHHLAPEGDGKWLPIHFGEIAGEPACR